MPLLSSSSSSSSSCLINSCLAWYRSYHFMHLTTTVKVSTRIAYCHNVLSPQKFIIIIIIMLIITFTEGVYNNIPETIHVSWVYSVAAVLYLQFVLLLCPWNRFCLLLSSSSSPLCRVLTFLRQIMSLGNTVLQLFCCFYLWCLYRYLQCWLH